MKQKSTELRQDTRQLKKKKVGDYIKALSTVDRTNRQNKKQG